MALVKERYFTLDEDILNIHIQVYTLNFVVGHKNLCLLTALLKYVFTNIVKSVSHRYFKTEINTRRREGGFDYPAIKKQKKNAASFIQAWYCYGLFVLLYIISQSYIFMKLTNSGRPFGLI